jgi:hypothetical protein
MTNRVVEELVHALREDTLGGPYLDEAQFEQDFVEPTCTRILGSTHSVALHSRGDKTKSKCWAESKSWGATRAWGMVHAFDLVARHLDTREGLAVEVKLAKISRGHLPNGEFQRMMGQCLLARHVHSTVIGVFGHVGDLPARFETETAAIQRWLIDKHGIWIVVRRVDTS